MLDSPLPPTATEAACAVASGRMTAMAVLDACLERIEAREGVVRAFAALDIEGARAQARRVDAGQVRGPLAGVPAGFKDIIDTAGLATEYNSPIYAGHVPVADASVVALSRAAGALVLGKTVTCEFANRKPGPTTNPHDPARTPGGSSSGSAAAVGAGMVPLALGTQTSGSVIRPASFCGVHGFKGTWGEISYAGTKLTSRSLDTIGIYARSLSDIALYRAVLTMVPPTAITVGNVAAPRVGLCLGPYADQADPCMVELLESVAARLGKAGATVVAYEPPRAFGGLNDAARWISAWEGARSLAWEKTFHRGRISPELADGRISDGEACSPEWYAACVRLGERCRVEFEAAFEEVDVVLTFAAPGEAPPGIGETGIGETGSAVFNTMWTLLHVPCVTVPGHSGPNGMPLGFQLVGRRYGDRRLLDVARWVERAVG